VLQGLPGRRVSRVGDDVAAGEPLVDVRFLYPFADDEFDFSVPLTVSGTVLAIDRQVGEADFADLQLAVVGAAPRPPEALTVELDHTIVSFGRPWWDEVCLAARNWMVPGFRRGRSSAAACVNPSRPL
jgi:hypothetical protein